MGQESSRQLRLMRLPGGALQPTAGPPVPQEVRDALARDAQRKLPGQPLRDAFDFAGDILEGATVTDPFEDREFSSGEKIGSILGAMPAVGPVAAPIKGLWSRVSKAASALPSQFHPNKALSALQSLSSKEELDWRKVPEFLKSHGNTPVKKTDLLSHLDENREPDVNALVRGEKPPPISVTFGSLEPDPHTSGFRVAVQPPNEEAARHVPFDASWQDQSYATIVPRRRDVNHRAVDWTAFLPGEMAGPGDGRGATRLGGMAPHRDFPNVSEAEAWVRQSQIYPLAKPTKFDGYTLPGGENYRETLLQLDRPRGKTGGELYDDLASNLQERYGPTYSQDASPEELAELDRFYRMYQEEPNALLTGEPNYYTTHWEEPNVLAHSRHKDRWLPDPPGARTLDQIGEEMRKAVGAKDVSHLASGAPEAAVRKGVVTPQEAAYFGRAKGYTNYMDGPLTQGGKGRFIEEIQSDWHQAGRDHGYASAHSLAEIAAAEARFDAAMQRKNELEDALEAKYFTPEELEELSKHNVWNDNTHREFAERFGWQSRMSPEDRKAYEDAFLRVSEAENAMRAVQNPSGVPDAPFKDTYPDLALKQQLLDVANRPDLEWLGWTTGKTQADRYNLADQFSRIDWDGEHLRAYRQDEPFPALTEPANQEQLRTLIGRELADRLVANGRVVPEDWRDPANFRVEPNMVRNWDDDGNVVDATPEIQNGWNLFDGDNLVRSEIGWDQNMTAEQALAQQVERQNRLRDDAPYRLEGINLEMGGEGMKYFYDNLLPKRYEKLIKPHGGAPAGREPLMAQKGWSVQQNPEAPNSWAALDDFGTIQHVSNTREDIESLVRSRNAHLPAQVEAWIARLSPEVKKSIREKGFPLMALMMLMQQDPDTDPNDAVMGLIGQGQ